MGSIGRLIKYLRGISTRESETREVLRAAKQALEEKQYAQAEVLAQRGLEMAQAARLHDVEALCLATLGKTLVMTGRVEKAMALAPPPGGRAQGLLMFQVARAFHEQRKWEQSIDAYREAIDLLQEKADRFERKWARQDLAVAYYRLGRYQDALAESWRAVEMENLDRRPADRACDWAALGAVQTRLGMQSEAQQSHGRATELGRRCKDFQALYVAVKCLLFRDFAAAIPWLERTLLTKNASRAYWARTNLGISLLQVGRAVDAENVFRKQWEAVRGGENVEMEAVAINNLAVALREQGRLQEAENWQRQAVVMQETAGLLNGRLANSLKNLGLVLRRAGREREAREMLERGLRIAENVNAPVEQQEQLRTALAGENNGTASEYVDVGAA